MDPSSWLLLCRSVRFGDTDAAGVMHFPRLLEWCHQAYEESLERYGIASAEVFPTPEAELEVALPVVHCHADYRRPLVCGDPLAIALAPQRLDPGCFEVAFTLTCRGDTAATALTRHVAINRERRRCGLPEPLNRWLEASSLGGVQPL